MDIQNGAPSTLNSVSPVPSNLFQKNAACPRLVRSRVFLCALCTSVVWGALAPFVCCVFVRLTLLPTAVDGLSRAIQYAKVGFERGF